MRVRGARVTKTAEKAPAASRAAVPPLSSPPAGAAEAPGVAAVPAPVAPAGTLLPKLALSLLLAGGFVWVLQRGGLPIMPPRSAFAYLAGLRRAEGSYRYSRRYAATPVWVTSQVLAALAKKPFPLD